MQITPVRAVLFSAAMLLPALASAQTAPAPAAPVAATPVPVPAPVEVGAASEAVPVPVPAPVEGGVPALAADAAAAAMDGPDGPRRGFIAQNSLGGAVGLLRMSSAETGMVGHLRLGLHGEYFTATKFLIESADMRHGGDVNTRLQGALTFGVTPLPYLEIFGAVLGSANENERCRSDQASATCISEDGRTDPEIMKASGDVVVGAKLAYPLEHGFSMGAEVGLRLLSSVAGLTFNGDATSLWFGGIGTWNVKKVAPALPLRTHLNLGMYLDNSYSLQDFDASKTTRPSRLVSSFAYGMAKDRIRASLGVDAPMHDVADGLSLRPMVEYHVEYVTGSRDEAFADIVSPPNCGPGKAQACRDNKDQMWLTVGAQAQVLHGLTFTVGLDVALRSVGFPYGPPLAPWNMIFGASYPLDLVPRVVTRVVPVEKVVTVEKPAAPNEGYVVGKVVSTTGTPVEGAIIGAVGREHSRVASDADGTFRSVGLASGPVELVITANTHETATVKADVVAGQTVNLAVTLTPRSPAARAAGRIADETGKGVTANVKLAGPQLVEGKADESGVFSIPVLPGQYVMRIEADQYLSKELPLNVVEGPENPVAITLHARPAVAGVVYAEGKLTLRQPITFKMAGRKPTAELTPGMPLLLDEIIDVLVNHPEIRQIRIEAHTDSSLPPAKAQALTDQQAKAVADYLVAQGIPRERVAPAGMGSSKPLVPNLGKAGRAKNRRVELVVVN